MPVNVEFYQRLSKPVAFVAPLHADGVAPRTYVIGITSYLPDEVALEWVKGSATCCTVFGPSWRPDEIQRVELNDKVANALPPNLFVRELLTEFDWATAAFNWPLMREFRARFGDTGYVAAFCTRAE